MMWLVKNLYWIVPTIFSVILTVLLVVVAFKQSKLQEQSLKIDEEQSELQKKNVQISKEQNDLQKQIVKISDEQKEIQKQNVKLALFEKRYDVYLKLRNAISNFTSSNKVDILDGFEMIGELRDKVYYLFDDDITKYYLQIINTASLLHSNITTPQDKGFKDSQVWLLRQLEKKELRTNFERYLLMGSFGVEEL